MFLFSKPKSYLGVDLGIETVKIVELKNAKGRPQLVTYGFTEQQINAERASFLKDTAKVANVLRRVCKESRVSTREAVAALPVSEIFSSVINLADISAKDLASASSLSAMVQWEAKKLIPLPLEEMILDWKIINEEGKRQEAKENRGKVKSLSVLLTAAPKDLVTKYLEVFKGAGLSLTSLETDAFAQARVFIGNDPSTVTIIDIGAFTTNISIIEHGVPYLNKSVDIGGVMITKEISNKMGVEVEDAEQFKIDLANNGDVTGLYKILDASLDALINEIRYCFDIYSRGSGTDAAKIEKIILTGGTSLLANLPVYLADKLEKRVFVGDPWAKVIYPADLRPILEQIGPKLSGAVGLAMRNI